jgi:hypothetical protein
MATSSSWVNHSPRANRAMQESTVCRTLRARVALALSAVCSIGLLAACAASDGAHASARVAPSESSGEPIDAPASPAPEVDLTGTTAADAAAASEELDQPKPWTDAFGQKAVIVAEHVRIEGPDGLLDHVVVSADDAFYERAVTHDGATLTQITMRLSNDVPIIRAQLDQWQIAAFRQVTVIERAEPCDVAVVATGDASLRDPLGMEERGETLRWMGTIPR